MTTTPKRAARAAGSDTCDVIVVGGGGSGLAAACAVAQRRGRVLLFEKRPQLGGTTAIAVGSLTAAGTRTQRRAGIEDDAGAHAEDAARFAPPEIEARNHAALRRWFLSHTEETVAWLEAMGVSFVGPSPEPPNRVPRMHNVIGGGRTYVDALAAELARRGGEVVCNAHVEQLLVERGRVVGVRHQQAGHLIDCRATRGVILATGDYASSPQWIAAHRGSEFAQIEGINPHSTGDGHRMIEAVGGRLVNMDVTYGPEIRLVAPETESKSRSFWVLGPLGRLAAGAAARLPRSVMRHVARRMLVTWQHPENALFDEGAILVNREGHRFVDECHSPAREIAIAEQRDKIAFMLLDERLATLFSAWPHFVSTAPDIAYAYVDDYLRLRPDVAVAAGSLAEVARLRGLDHTALAETVETYNAAARGERADPFGRRPCGPLLAGHRWVLLGPAKAYFTTTEGGAAIDRRLRVLDCGDDAVPGLFAVGQAGLGGMVLWGHGLHIAWAVTSGRLAGAAVMQDADRSDATSPQA